ncbi:EamA family transporter [Mucilaginibacter psychrotolerans]|uniref:EamA family transporter n=1 Tax=Mucilaginibacter psychrotolerans TaxID=1524096 RepID=A0A4Y8SK69_9SPHI|nr:EamA family transporter [Mucilaginibacter psychrotolerans]TFF39262.1 EamA family transporter [Mucilaginibacter psychrotolerans]
METKVTGKPSTLLVVIAFAAVYVVWGSTYFFIQMALHGIPPMIMGAIRFIAAGILLLSWCYLKGDRIFDKATIKASGISGLLTLFVATGIVIWVEKFIPSAMVAIMVSANPIWFVVLDRANWKVNLKSRSTIWGLIIGFGGVVLLFGEAFSKSIAGGLDTKHLVGLLLLIVGPIAWSVGSLYSKKTATGAPARVNTSWQMLVAGIAFIPVGFIDNEYATFHISAVPLQAWMAVLYLIFFGSIAAFSAYVWLLQVRPATQVSTHSYVNPVIAVLLGVLFAGEIISWLQIIGLVIILLSVLLVNLSKYSFGKPKVVKVDEPLPIKGEPVLPGKLCA